MQMLKLDQQDFLGEACCNLSEVDKTSIALMMANPIYNLLQNFLFYTSYYIKIFKLWNEAIKSYLFFVLCSFHRLSQNLTKAWHWTFEVIVGTVFMERWQYMLKKVTYLEWQLRWHCVAWTWKTKMCYPKVYG